MDLALIFMVLHCLTAFYIWHVTAVAWAIEPSCGRFSSGAGVAALAPGESYSFQSFPPKLHPRSLTYHDRDRYTRGPEECTWIFEAVGNCILEFQPYSFERGDVLCENQYFLIGDEHREQRYCGFRAPQHFRSSGRRLFLTHYQNNGYNRRTIESRFGGRIRCKECPPLPEPDCKVFQEFNNNASSGIHSVLIDVHGSDQALFLGCGSSSGCTFIGTGCTLSIVNASSIPAGCDNKQMDLTLPSLPSTGPCTTSSILSCPNPGTCNILIDESILGQDPVDGKVFNCNPQNTSSQTCAYAYKLCSTLIIDK